MSKIVCIDPGHGGTDVGAVRGNRYEKSDNLRMAKAVKALLEAQGVKVVLTRDNDANPSLSGRCDIANNAKADYFLSVHRNSFGNQTATGAEIWVHHAAQQSTIGKAQKILDEVLAVCGKNRGVKKGYTGNPNADYAINRESNMASALLELLFISSDYDNGLYDRYFDKLAEAVARGLCAAVGVEYGEQKPAPKPSAPSTSSGFFPGKGYFGLGDKHENVAKIASFMRRVFPAYTNEKALGDLYGPYIQSAIKEFQKRTGIETDGNTGPITLSMLKKYGFKV